MSPEGRVATEATRDDVVVAAARRRRKHDKQFSFRTSTRQFRIDTARIKRYLEKKMRRLPCGTFEVKLSCLGTAPSGGGILRLTSSASSSGTNDNDDDNTRGEGGGGGNDDGNDDVLSMPENAEKRAKKLRELLRVLWSRGHAKGTRWESCRQIYRAVNSDGAPPFEWWDRVANRPFDSAAIADAQTSRLIYLHVAPLVHAISTSL